MAMDNEEGMDAAMNAFAKLGPIGSSPIETNDDPKEEDQVEEPLDEPAEQEDDGAEDGDPSEAEEQEEEPASPGLDPPATWDAEAKKVFATLPPQVQQMLVERESDRERTFHAKAREAADARKQSDALVNEYTNLHRQFAEQLDTYAQAFQPQRPDWQLAATDPQAFASRMAMFEAATAQQQDLLQRAASARQQAEQIEKQQLDHFQREESQRIVQAIPDMADPVKAKAMWNDFTATAKELGYDDDLINQARAVDVIGLKKASEWRDKAGKWDALQASKMQTVRDAKGKPKVATPGTAQPKGSARAQGLQDSMNRLRKSGDVRDAAAAFARLG